MADFVLLEDAERITDAARPRTASSRFTLVRFGKIKPLDGDEDYCVKTLLPRSGLVVIWGPPKCGKSFWTFDLLMHVALGWDYRGMRVKGGSVVYGRPFPSYKMKLREASPSLRTPS